MLKNKPKYIIASLSVISLLFVPGVASAQNARALEARDKNVSETALENRTTNNGVAQTNANPNANVNAVEKGNKSEVSNVKLDATRQKVCEKRETAIKNIMIRIEDRSRKQLRLFSDVAGRVDEFYAKHERSIDNYYELKQAMQDKYLAVENSFRDEVTARESFGCSKDDPKGAINQFREVNEVSRTALKEYRDSVNDFIVAVKSSNGTLNSASESEQE